MNDRIDKALNKLFDRHRIVFWYDAKKELRHEFEALGLPGVEKVELTNNEFGVKHRVLREQPGQKFLLYLEGAEPQYLENWLLDVQLAHGVFRTDQVALWLSELELGHEFTELVTTHAEFFQSTRRKEALKKLLKADDTPGRIRLSMLAVCAGGEATIEAVMEELLQEVADGREDKMKLIARCALDTVLWEHLSRCYGYRSEQPGIRDFAVTLFKSCYAAGTEGRATLNGDAEVFLKRWKDSRTYEQGFDRLSDECAAVLGIEQDLVKRDFRNVLELDYFRLIDRKIISDLVRAVTERTVSVSDVSVWIRQRRQGHWFAEFVHLYEAVEYAADFIHTLGEAKLSMESLADAMQRYTTSWFKLDQLYRKYIFHMKQSGQSSLLQVLTEQIENHYCTTYLSKLGNAFQVYVDAADSWGAQPFHLQRDFFEYWVQPFLRKDNKVCVIISDALRYEVGEELLSLVRKEDRFNAELEPALAMLPSYTQLGMAALLPNKELTIAENDAGSVLVDGRNSTGAANRGIILSAGVGGKSAIVVKADDFLNMPRDGDHGYRALFSKNDVVYIYHDRIDAVGDRIATEEHVFKAVEETLEELVRIIRRLSTANATNMLVTSDHGFIYQHRELDESDFTMIEEEVQTMLYRNRRFIVGRDLSPSPALRTFHSAQLGLTGELQVQIPKSINRLRLRGAGSRFVHGGATLQEVVIPVLKINKKRQSDVSNVDVEILRGTSSIITSGQLSVTMYQTSPVTDKVRARTLQAGIYTESGELISDSHELTFDWTSENPRERERQVRFMFTRKADEANGQEVVLKLTEKHAGTSHYKEYKSLRYMMRRSFTNDFDF